MIESLKDKVQITVADGQEEAEEHKSVAEQKQDNIIGMCEQFISKNERNARELDKFQISTPKHKSWQPMACHFRNIQYINQNVRSPKTLVNCLDFICSEYLPYYREVFQEEAERKRLQLFLYDRLRSIRCEFYVQNVLDPKAHQKLFKIILFLETMIGQPIEISSVQIFLQNYTKNRNLQNQENKQDLYEFLEYAIFIAKREKLSQILDNYWEQISTSDKLMDILEAKTKILQNNYIKYLQVLHSHQNIYTRLILWSEMSSMRKLILSLYKKAKMNERAGFLCRVLGYSKMDGWVNISDAKDMEKLEKNKKHFDMEIKLWVPEAQLLKALEKLQDTCY